MINQRQITRIKHGYIAKNCGWKTQEMGEKTRNWVKIPNIHGIDTLEEMKIKVTQEYYLEKWAVFFPTLKNTSG